jgi:hypothetical protein
MNIDPAILVHWIERLGIPIILVIAFIKGWIVPAYVYVQLEKSEREFRSIALRFADQADRSIKVNERLVEQNKP